MKEKRLPWDLTREMFLSEQEAAVLLAHVEAGVEESAGRRALTARLDRLLIHALLFSGVRSTEFCKLMLADTSAVTGQPAFVVRGGNARTVALPEHVDRLVREYCRQVRPHFLPEGTDPADPRQALVYNEHLQPFERTGLYRRVVRVLTAAGLGERASIQLLRHTYGYLAYLRTGGNLLFVQRQLGHAHPMVTAIYAKFVNESYTDLANRLAAIPARQRGHRRSAE